MAGGKLISTGVEFPDATTQTTSGLPLTGGALTGAVTTTSTFDGRDVAADGVTADAALPKAGGTMTGTIAGFTSTGIDDNATSTAITIDASENVSIAGSVTATTATTIGLTPLLLDSRYRLRAINHDDGPGGMQLQTQSTNETGTTNASGRTLKLNPGGGDVYVGANLVIGTSGKGIDFSAATPDGTGTVTSEVLDDYEEGTWTPTPTQGITGGLSIVSASYTKIGRTVTWSMFINSFTGNTSNLYIGGLPFANQGSNGYSMQSNINSSANNATITNPHFRIEPSGSYLRALKNNDSSIIGTELDYSHIIASGTYQTD